MKSIQPATSWQEQNELILFETCCKTDVAEFGQNCEAMIHFEWWFRICCLLLYRCLYMHIDLFRIMLPRKLKRNLAFCLVTLTFQFKVHHYLWIKNTTKITKKGQLNWMNLRTRTYNTTPFNYLIHKIHLLKSVGNGVPAYSFRWVSLSMGNEPNEPAWPTM